MREKILTKIITKWCSNIISLKKIEKLYVYS